MPIIPPWLDTSGPTPEAPQPIRSARGQFVPGVSGNPAGKPVGAKAARTLMHAAFHENGEAIAKVVIDKALDGDLVAAGLVLQRLVPPKKPVGERVHFTLDTTRPLAQQASQVIQAVADGDLDPDNAQTVLSCLGTYAALMQADALESRLQALERAHNITGARGGVIYMEEGPTQ